VGHFSLQRRTAFVEAFRAPHGATGLIDPHGVLDRHTAVAARIGFALIKQHFEQCTTCAATEARVFWHRVKTPDYGHSMKSSILLKSNKINKQAVCQDGILWMVLILLGEQAHCRRAGSGWKEKCGTADSCRDRCSGERGRKKKTGARDKLFSSSSTNGLEAGMQPIQPPARGPVDPSSGRNGRLLQLDLHETLSELPMSQKKIQTSGFVRRGIII
jgi:hypothetical protein